MQRRAALFAAGLAVLPGIAEAHAFTGGLPFDLAFLTGVLAVVASPWIILPILALGIGPGIWSDARQRPLWLVFLIGMLAALVVAPYLAGPWADILPLFLGILVAIHAALFNLNWAAAVPKLLGLAMGFTVSLAGFYGYQYLEVQIATQIGYLIAAMAVLIIPGEIVRTTRHVFPGPVVPIIWRIVSSWVAAICVLYLAFTWTL
ncbi:MAG: hypothetical protein P8X50_13395 [Maritimibacter sp.]